MIEGEEEEEEEEEDYHKECNYTFFALDMAVLRINSATPSRPAEAVKKE